MRDEGEVRKSPLTAWCRDANMYSRDPVVRERRTLDVSIQSCLLPKFQVDVRSSCTVNSDHPLEFYRVVPEMGELSQARGLQKLRPYVTSRAHHIQTSCTPQLRNHANEPTMILRS